MSDFRRLDVRDLVSLTTLSSEAASRDNGLSPPSISRRRRSPPCHIRSISNCFVPRLPSLLSQTLAHFAFYGSGGSSHASGSTYFSTERPRPFAKESMWRLQLSEE